jgi:hypothetical protein
MLEARDVCDGATGRNGMLDSTISNDFCIDTGLKMFSQEDS